MGDSELFIQNNNNKKCNETKFILKENNEIVEYFVENGNQDNMVNKIFYGIVKDVNGIFAFVDIGFSRNAFLQINDPKNRHLKIKKQEKVVVQLTKNQVKEKGAVVCGELVFKDKYIVLLKNDYNTVSVSSKIIDRAQRSRLKEIGYKILPDNFSIIIRTESIKADEDVLYNSVQTLMKKYCNVIEKIKTANAPCVIRSFFDDEYEEFYNKNISLVSGLGKITFSNINKINIMGIDEEQKKIIEQLTNKEVIIDNNIDFDKMLHKLDMFLNDSKIWIENGGYIIIEKTSVGINIDVNSGGYDSRGYDEDLAKGINFKAASKIAYLIRLRDLSGVIIVDFINFKYKSDMQRLKIYFEKVLSRDSKHVFVTDVTSIGIFLLTRLKTSDRFF